MCVAYLTTRYVCGLSDYTVCVWPIQSTDIPDYTVSMLSMQSTDLLGSTFCLCRQLDLGSLTISHPRCRKTNMQHLILILSNETFTEPSTALDVSPFIGEQRVEVDR